MCSNGHCIGRHFVCDGKPDCKFGVDEAYENCGPNPCEGTPCLILYQINIVCSDMLLCVSSYCIYFDYAGKIPCENGRCIPMSWCCDEYHDPNCTTKVKPSCCQQLTTRSKY